MFNLSVSQSQLTFNCLLCCLAPPLHPIFFPYSFHAGHHHSSVISRMLEMSITCGSWSEDCCIIQHRNGHIAGRIANLTSHLLWAGSTRCVYVKMEFVCGRRGAADFFSLIYSPARGKSMLPDHFDLTLRQPLWPLHFLQMPPQSGIILVANSTWVSNPPSRGRACFCVSVYQPLSWALVVGHLSAVATPRNIMCLQSRRSSCYRTTERWMNSCSYFI